MLGFVRASFALTSSDLLTAALTMDQISSAADKLKKTDANRQNTTARKISISTNPTINVTEKRCISSRYKGSSPGQISPTSAQYALCMTICVEISGAAYWSSCSRRSKGYMCASERQMYLQWTTGSQTICSLMILHQRLVAMDLRKHFWSTSHGPNYLNQFSLGFFWPRVPLQHNKQQRSWEWHLLSFRAGRPKIKLLGWAPFAAFTEISWRTNGGDSYPVGRRDAHIRPQTHMWAYAETPLLHIKHTAEAESAITRLD